jgi:hypothetical protein
MRMITIFSPKDLTRPVPFEKVGVLDIKPIFQVTIPDVVLYIEGDRFKILKHFKPGYKGSELPYRSLRPIIMSAISLSQPESEPKKKRIP